MRSTMNSGKRGDIFGVAEGYACVVVGVAGWRPSDTAAHAAVWLFMVCVLWRMAWPNNLSP